MLGISLYIDEINSDCSSENTELTEIRKYIIHDDHRRPQCRTKLTVSMSREQCEKTIVHLEYYCQHPDKDLESIYFQGMILKWRIIFTSDNNIRGSSLIKKNDLKRFYRMYGEEYIAG